MVDAAEVAAAAHEAMPNLSGTTDIRATGSCLCGSVLYRVTGELRDIVACHCGQCRKTSGNYVAAAAADNSHLVVDDRGSLTWYQSSAQAKRGFCNRCGGNLFWKSANRDYTSIMAGTLDLPTNLTITHHIYVADASDYHLFHDNDVTCEKED